MSSVGLDRDFPSVASIPASAHSRVPARWAAKPGHRRQIVTCAEVLADLLAVTFALVFAIFVGQHVHPDGRLPFSWNLILSVAVGCAGCVVVLLDRDGAYHSDNSLLQIRETERALRASALTGLFAAPLLAYAARFLSPWSIVLALLCMAGFLVLEKQAVFLMLRRVHARGHGMRRVLIYGAGHTGRQVFSALVRSPKLQLLPVAMADDDLSLAGGRVFELGYQRSRSCTILPGPITPDLLRACQAEMMIVAIPSLSRTSVANLAEQAAALGVEVAFVAADSLHSGARVDYRPMDGLLLGWCGRARSEQSLHPAQSALDLILAAIFLVALSPLLFLIAVLIRLDSPGPALFRQKRVGRYGQLFTMYKFRTMRAEASAYALSPSHPGDPRITRIGRFLRRTSLDELPQLLNVLRGEMSLVGPRPEMPFIAEQYTDRERLRLQTKPGITGLWQISADRAFLIHQSIQYDLYYIQHRSFFLDLAILLHTALFAMRGT